MKFLIFFIISLLTFIFSFISIFTAPIINNIIKDSSKWGILNCKQYSDLHQYYENIKDSQNIFENDIKKEKYLNYLKEGNKLCNKKVSMYNLEYISLIIDIIIGFICSILTLIAKVEEEEYKNAINFVKKMIGPLGFVAGIIGFILTLLYIIFSELIFNNGSPGKEYENPNNPNNFNPYNSNKIYRLDEERAFAEWSKHTKIYECFYYNENDEDSFYVRYKELGQKQYNYNKEMYIYSNLNNSKIRNCNCNSESCVPEEECKIHRINNKFLRPEYGNELWCPVLVFNNDEINKNTTNKYIYDRWLASIVFGYFIIILNAGLILFGILIYKEKEDV